VRRAAPIDLDAAASAVSADAFEPPGWLRGAHRQTVVGSLWPRRPLPEASASWVASDPGTRLLCHAHLRPGREGRTALVIVHGMAGSSASGPAVDLAWSALRRGLSVVRMNMRNCGGTESCTPGLYHANLPGDVLAVVRHLVDQQRFDRIVLAGYSVGASLVLNFLGGLGGAVPAEVASAVAICPAIDVAHCVSLVDERPSNRVYREHFLRALRGFYLRKSRLDPRRFPGARMRDVRTLRAFDAAATAPDAGFTDVDAFYRWVSAVPRLARVTVPTLVLHATDDPVVELLPSSRTALAGARMIRLVEVPFGGHCSFLERASPRRPDGRWAAYQVARFAAG
jgi:uncharacterized protein